ncbi:MAG TPA: helix-turn-helix domain-containing protein [Selenomonadales bacterium]|nr:helix-turn-helix domain-containing protein [Selenomonadales bacterium]
MGIGKRISELRSHKGWSTNKLAKMAGIAQSAMRSIELEEKSPTINTLTMVLQALDISFADFFAEKKPELEPELCKLLDNAKKLSPEQRESVLRLLETMNKE